LGAPLFLRLVLLCTAMASSLAAAPDPSLPAPVLQELLDSQDAYYRLDFDGAEALANAAIQAVPDHPLPRVFLSGAVLARIQEEEEAKRFDRGDLQRFKEDCAVAVAKSQARLGQADNAWGHLYLGAALGARGLGQLYQGHYLAAYGDGKQADKQLHEAVRQDPDLDEAYLGLGQYEYYCAHLAGLLRLILNLHGNSKQGIAWLERCAQSPGFDRLAAAFTLARICSMEEIDFAKARPWIQLLQERYPQNHDLQDYAIRTAKGLGPASPEAQALLAPVCAQWDQGWRPPNYAPLADPRPLCPAAAAPAALSATVH
jgi:tetratricopeptide (TPR) repeat protein